MKTAEGEIVPIDRSGLSEQELYLASADVEAARKNRNEAVQRIADVIASRVHDAIDLYWAGRAEAVPEPERS